MPTATTLQFGSLETLYVLSEQTPKVGDVLKRGGDYWEVTEVQEEKDGTSTVTLAPWDEARRLASERRVRQS